MNVDLDRAMNHARHAMGLMTLVNGANYKREPEPYPRFSDELTKDKPREIEHVLCQITATLRVAMAEVEAERLKRFGWRRP